MNEIYIIADCSGGFCEMGKIAVQQYLLNTVNSINSLSRFDGFEFRAYIWNETIEEYTDKTRLKPENIADMNQLYEFINNLKSGSRVLILTDGLLDIESEIGRELKKLIKQRSIRLHAVSTGADSDRGMLEKIADEVYDSSEIINALSCLCFAKNRSEAVL